MKKTALWIIFITIISQSTGFLRDATLSNVYGASMVSDAYLVAVGIPLTLFAILGEGISTSFIPIYTQEVIERGKEGGNSYTNKTLSVLVVLSLIMVIIFFAFAKEVIWVFAGGFRKETADLAIYFLRYSLITISLTAILYIWRSYLQANEQFILPALMGIPMNIFIIISISLSLYVGPWMLIVGYISAYSLQVVFLYPGMKKTKWTYKFDFAWKDPSVRKMFRMMIPIAFGGSVGQLSVLVDRNIASTIMSGGITLLSYAARLTGVVQFAFGIAIVSVMFPEFSKLVSENKPEALKATLCQSLNAMSLLTLPAMIGIIVLSKPLIQLLFEHGAFTQADTLIAGEILFLYSLGLWGTGIQAIISRVFYAYQDTKTPVIYTSFALILNIILDIALSKFMGISGIALATSIAVSVATLLMMLRLYKKIGFFFSQKSFLESNLKIIFASIVMGVCAYCIHKNLIMIISYNLATIISILLSMLIYGGLVILLQVKEAEFIWKKFCGV